MDNDPGFQIQLGGETTWCVTGWRTYDQDDDSAPDLVAVYGPVPTKGDAERLAQALAGMTPGAGATALFTVVRACPIQIAPDSANSAVVAR